MRTKRDTTGNLVNTEVHSKCFYYHYGGVLGLYVNQGSRGFSAAGLVLGKSMGSVGLLVRWDRPNEAKTPREGRGGSRHLECHGSQDPGRRLSSHGVGFWVPTRETLPESCGLRAPQRGVLPPRVR